jgi:rifampicin phosphotransferase
LKLGDHAWAGDKAARLGELIAAQFNVPSGFCIGADAYRDVIASPLNDKIMARLAQTEIDDPIDLETATDDIRAWIEHAPLPDALANEIRAIASNDAMAIRASRIVEDVPNPAASGLQQAYLGVTGFDAMLSAIRQVWALPWNSRAIYYRHRKKMPTAQVTMAIVVQPMVNADAAGVLFTANPLTGAANEIHIDSTYGLGAAIIAARWKPDHFVVAQDSLTITQRDNPNKSVMEIASSEGGLESRVVPDEMQDVSSLTDAHVATLAELGKRIEKQFGTPQDIEWCRIGDQILVLQTRPLAKK